MITNYKSGYKYDKYRQYREDKKNKRYEVKYVEYSVTYFKQEDTYFKEIISSHGKEVLAINSDEIPYEVPELIKVGRYRDLKRAKGKLRIRGHKVFIGETEIDDFVIDNKSIQLSTGYVAIFDWDINLKWYRDNLINRGYDIKTSEYYLSNVIEKLPEYWQ